MTAPPSFRQVVADWLLLAGLVALGLFVLSMRGCV